MTLQGPRLPARSGRTRQLIVLLHGYGADGRDLIDLGDAWGAALPDAAFVAPHAPHPCDQAPTGRQWFPLQSLDPASLLRGVHDAAPILDRFLDVERDSHGLNDDDIALIGFSQGAMMALHVGLRRRAAPAALIGLSGVLIGPPLQAKTTPPVLLVHGSLDDVEPPEALQMASDALVAAGVSCTPHLLPGLGHTIDDEVIALCAAFLLRAFKAPGSE